VSGDGRAARARGGLLLAAGAGATVGLLDAARARLLGDTVLPPSGYPVAVLLYAAVVAPAGALAGALLAPARAAAAILAFATALGAGLAANRYLLPAFADPVSLIGDAVVLGLAALLARALGKRFEARGVPGRRAAAIAGGGALALSLVLAIGGGRDDGPAPGAARRDAGRGPDVLLVVVDTLRADAVGAGTPRWSALAAEGARFETCRAPSSWTKPSTASLMTALYPSEHGALEFESVLPGAATTLAETLRAAGWRTAAFTDNPFVSVEYGFGQGFDAFSGRAPSTVARGTLLLQALSQVRLRLAGGAAYSFGPGVEIGADGILGGAVDFLLAQDARPAFAYAHLIEPHYPYTPPPPFDGGRPRVDPPHSSGILPFDSFPALPAADVATMRANYAGEVSAADAALGRALDRLRAAGRLDGTIVVVTSDHGEEFHEHGGWTHGQSLYEELVRVPLVIRGPGGAPGAGRRIEAPVSLVDVAPTVLDLAGVASGAPASGRSLVPLLEGRTLPPVPHFAEIRAGPVGARAVFLAGDACIVARKAGREACEAYDLRRDPGQRVDRLAASGEPGGPERRLREVLDAAFASMEAGALPRESRAFDEETKRALEAIGYGGK
jgi:arylsulfatase A-like enzyme